MTQLSNLFSHQVARIVVLAIFLIVTCSGIAAASIEIACEHAVPLDLNHTVRANGIDNHTVQLMSVDLPSPGIATVDVSIAGQTSARPKVGLLRDRCGESEYTKQEIAVIERSSSHLVLAARSAGTFYLRVAAQDSRQALQQYKLRTTFVPADVREDEIYLEHGLSGLFGQAQVVATQTSFHADVMTGKSEQEESDPDPGSKRLSMAGGLLLSHVTLQTPYATKSEQEESDPDPGSKRFSPVQRVDLMFFHDEDALLASKSEQEESDPDPGSKSEQEESDPDPGSKSEQEESDPDPGSKIAEADRGFYGVLRFHAAAPASKSEQEESDPDPGSKRLSRSALGRVSTHLVSFTVSDDVLSGSDKAAATILDWFLGSLSATSAGPRFDAMKADGHIQLLSHSSAADISTRRFRSGDVCLRGETDDHGDTRTCATPLGRMAAGELRNDWGDDADVFTFTLTELRNVTLETVGDVETTGTLYDRWGQALAADSSDGSRIVTTLAPGQYFLEVRSGQADEGIYEVQLEASDW